MSAATPGADCAERMDTAVGRPLAITYPADLAEEIEQIADLLHKTSAYLGRLRDWAVAEHAAGRLELATLIPDEMNSFLAYLDAARARASDAGEALQYSYDVASDMRRAEPPDVDEEAGR